MPETISTIYNLRLSRPNPEVNVWNVRDDLFSKLPDRIKQRVGQILVGIEVEIENAIEDLDGNIRPPSGWDIQNDPSLRNNGREYVTNYGVRLGFSKAMLERLRIKLEKSREDHPKSFVFSERTSVHVHLDARHFTMEQVQNFLILYTLFEDSLFRYVDAARAHNIYCTPIRSTFAPNNTIKAIINDWHKYSALNLCTLKKYGTFEFRHMEGNCNPEYIFHWICILGLLHYAAMRITNKELRTIIKDVKSESHYQALIDKIFFSFAAKIKYDPQEIDRAASDSKLFFI